MLEILYKSLYPFLLVFFVSSLSVYATDNSSAIPSVVRASESPAPVANNPGSTSTNLTPPFETSPTSAPANIIATSPSVSTNTSSLTTSSTNALPLVVSTVKDSNSSLPISKKNYQQIMENPSNPWLDEDVSLDAKARIERMRASSPVNPADIKMKSLYPAWKEAIDKYPPWIEAFSYYPPWTPTAYSVGYKSWNMATNDTQGLALALAESKYNIGNIDSFNQYIKSLETSGLLPGTQFIKKEDRTGEAGLNSISDQTIEQYDAAKEENNRNPVVRGYMLLQNGVNFWESLTDPLGKIKGMCCIMSSKAQIILAKAEAIGYSPDSISSAAGYATQAFNNAKEAVNMNDPKRLAALYELIVGASMEAIKIIGLASYNPSKRKSPVDSRMSALIIDADAKISYFIDVISQSSQNMMQINQADLMNDLRIVAQELQTMSSLISQKPTIKIAPLPSGISKN